MIEKGARLDNDALNSAVDDYAIVNFLLSQGARVVSAPGKSSAITNAAGGGNEEVVRLLIAHANAAELDSSRDALNWAAARGRIDTAEILIEHGFDVNAITKDCWVGETPLLAACMSREPNPQKMAVAKMLIKNGADINVRKQDGKTAAEMLVHNDAFREETELQQLLAGANTTLDDILRRSTL